jgi:hypothetical protein
MAGFWVELADRTGLPWLAAAVEAPDAAAAGEYAAWEGRAACARAHRAVPTLASVQVWRASSGVNQRPGGPPAFTAGPA